MAKAKAAKASNRRGSPEAIAKRRAGRKFNDLLSEGVGPKRDGRTEKRRKRLLSELESGNGRGGRELKPLDVLLHVQELLDMGEPLSAIRKTAKPRKSSLSVPAAIEIVSALQRAYGFRPEVYRFVGIGEDVLRDAGVLEEQPPRGRRRS